MDFWDTLLQNLAKMKLKHKLDWIQMGARHPRNLPQSRFPLRWKMKTKPFLKAGKQRLLTKWKAEKENAGRKTESHQLLGEKEGG